MNTLKNLRMLLNLTIGCMICVAVAGLGLYPYRRSKNFLSSLRGL